MKKRLGKGRKSPASALALLKDEITWSAVTDWIPTGFLGLDYVLGGGWPVGRVSELFGPEESGKSALTHRAIKACQDAGGFAVLIDAESSMDPAKLDQIGIDPSRLLWSDPDYLEQAWAIVEALLDELIANPRVAPTLVVWDSLGAIPPQADLEDPYGTTVAGQARVNSRSFQRLVRKVTKARAHLLLVTQERTKLGGNRFFGTPTDTVGGRALKFYATHRVRCAKVATLKGKGNSGPATGYLVRATTKKNKLCPPQRQVTWVLDFVRGPSPELTVFQALKDAGKIRPVPGTSRYRLAGDRKHAFTRTSWCELLAEDSFRQAAEALYSKLVASQVVFRGGGGDGV